MYKGFIRKRNVFVFKKRLIQKVIAAIILNFNKAKELSIQILPLTSLELPIQDGRKVFAIEFTATVFRSKYIFFKTVNVCGIYFFFRPF